MLVLQCCSSLLFSTINSAMKASTSTTNGNINRCNFQIWRTRTSVFKRLPKKTGTLVLNRLPGGRIHSTLHTSHKRHYKNKQFSEAHFQLFKALIYCPAHTVLIYGFVARSSSLHFASSPAVVLPSSLLSSFSLYRSFPFSSSEVPISLSPVFVSSYS